MTAWARAQAPPFPDREEAWRRRPMLHINSLTYRIEGRTLFDKATVALPAGVKAGLVGRNGAGKSTLLRLITGELAPESGSISLRKGARIGTVAQEAPGGEESLLEVVLAADRERAALLAEAETATDPGRIGEIHTRLADIEAHSATSRAAAILAGLGFSQEQMEGPCSALSGGWRMRVALAAALFAAPDLLLLDEPTNYLDLEGVLWLKTYLKSYAHTVLLVSHDRDILNASVNAIIHLSGGKLSFHAGGFDAFRRRLAEQQAQQMKLRKKQEERRRRMQAFVERFRAKASKARQAQSRLKALERMEVVDAVVEEKVAPFFFPAPARALNPPLVSLEDAAVGYDGRAVLKDMNLRIDTDDRIALLGANGQGKSTFAKMLCGRLALMAGRMRHHRKMQVGYFAQHQMDELAEGRTPHDYFRELMEDSTEAQRRARLGQYGFGAELADNPVKSLSGGEKARLLFALAAFRGPHLLILDEPTNHLDMEARAALVEALSAYEGALILISHDRHLLEASADRLWLAQGGTVAPFDGDLADYEAQVLERARQARQQRRSGGREGAARRAPRPRRQRENLGALRRALRELEARMAQMEEKLSVLDAALDGGRLYAEDAEKAARMAAARAVLARELEESGEKWLELSVRLDESEVS